MSAGVRLRGVRKGKTLAVDSTMLVKRSVSPDGRIDPLSKVSLDPGVQSAPHGATRCNTASRKTLMFWHVDADSIPPASILRSAERSAARAKDALRSFSVGGLFDARTTTLRELRMAGPFARRSAA